jgi:hypothetical protein
LWGYVKLEVLKLNSKLNHFALKSKLYIKAFAAISLGMAVSETFLGFCVT